MGTNFPPPPFPFPCFGPWPSFPPPLAQQVSTKCPFFPQLEQAFPVSVLSTCSSDPPAPSLPELYPYFLRHFLCSSSRTYSRSSIFLPSVKESISPSYNLGRFAAACATISTSDFL